MISDPFGMHFHLYQAIGQKFMKEFILVRKGKNEFWNNLSKDEHNRAMKEFYTFVEYLKSEDRLITVIQSTIADHKWSRRNFKSTGCKVYMENVKEQDKIRRTQRAASYVNRMGHQYFVHQGLTKTGKPKYFASQKCEGALAKSPDGFVFGESINGIVTIQRPKPLMVSETDIDLVKQKVAEFQHLKHYRVEAKDKAILIYEPMGMESVNTLAKLGSYSMLENLKSMLGSKFEDALVKTAKEMGITVNDLKRVDALSAEERRKRGAEHLIRNIQYDAV